LSQRGIRVTVVAKNIGYELRCAAPIPFDAAYCRDLGHSAIRFLLEGGSEAMVSLQGGRLVPIPFAELREPGTGRMRVRLVDIESESYRVAREYMLRLEREDFEYSAWVARLAQAANLSVGEFRNRFDYLSAFTPPSV
jgi:6-phosphofructokinase 1